MKARIASSIQEIPAAAWNALVGKDDPFVEHAFFEALETSQSVGEGTSWIPLYLLVEADETIREESALLGAMAAFLKFDSYGEYIFDFQWAQAAARSGINYYPKITSMVPFTPATGNRFFVRDDVDRNEVLQGLFALLRQIEEDLQTSSTHLLFLREDEKNEVEKFGFASRTTMQFHFHNPGYRDFQDFEDSLRSSARKQIRRERREAQNSDYRIEIREGKDLREEDLASLARLYEFNVERHGSEAYMQPSFFENLNKSLAHLSLAVMAFEKNGDGRHAVAASLNFEKGSHLYGRYWGCEVEAPFLHFECCYYALIERSIAKKYTRFEAGAQGIHKLKRGLMPQPVYSAHRIQNERLRKGVEYYLKGETEQVLADIAELAKHGPYRRGDCETES